ncbi:MAG TPA: diguanylate cyclase, partial [Abditibacteriaceae bacterium]
GGEEFLVLLPETQIDDAAAIAERLRYRIETLQHPALPPEMRATISLGVAQHSVEPSRAENSDGEASAEIPGPEKALAETIKRADVALYKAKGNGRNLAMRAG